MAKFCPSLACIYLILSLNGVLTFGIREVRSIYLSDYSEEDDYDHVHDSGPLPTPLLPVQAQSVSREDQIWEEIQPKLREMVDKYERTCRNSGVYFDRTAMEEELQRCFRPSIQELLNTQISMDELERLTLIYAIEEIKSGRRLDSDGVNVIRKSIVEPMCHFTFQILECFKPHYGHVMERCVTKAQSKLVEYSNLLVAASCRNNGSRVIEFLENGGLDCADIYAEHGMQCVESSKGQINKTHYSTKTTLELCEDLDKINGCLSSTLDQCPKKDAGKPLRDVFVELKNWTLNTCLRSTASSLPIMTVSVFSIWTILMLILSALHVGVQQ